MEPQIFTPESTPLSAGKCRDCGVDFTYQPFFIGGREMFPRKLCVDCCEKGTRALEAIEFEKERADRESRWAEVCPPLYRDTDPARIDPRCAQAARQWASGEKMGIGMQGATGKGKTRALFLALRTAFDGGQSCRAISHNSFSRLVQSAFSGDTARRRASGDTLDEIRNCGALLLDDLGKPPATDRADAELEELIEHRTSHFLPILWSANGSSAWLAERLGPDRGEPLIRRLSEFSTIVSLHDHAADQLL